MTIRFGAGEAGTCAICETSARLRLIERESNP
jgi:hypothetical protein